MPKRVTPCGDNVNTIRKKPLDNVQVTFGQSPSIASCNSISSDTCESDCCSPIIHTEVRLLGEDYLNSLFGVFFVEYKRKPQYGMTI